MSSRSSQACKQTVCLVSACLVGLPTRYDGRTKKCHFLPLQGFEVVPVCPETLGGLAIHRPPSMLLGGGDDVLAGRAKVVSVAGDDVTAAFIRGAELTLEIALARGARIAFLKGRSPSCGCCTVWIEGKLRRGWGVAAALLRKHGIICIEVD